MSEEKMQNPYEDELDTGEVKVTRGAACAVIAVFILILLLPPLYRNVYNAALGGDEAWIPVVEIFKRGESRSLEISEGPTAKKETITEHLRSFEKELEDEAAFTEPPRQFVQAVLTHALREGNRKAYIGRDGWLYLKPALDSLTGYGPLAPEPDSVAKDPNRKPWKAPLGAIKKFAAQLDELGVELVLVPIPVKPMIYPEHITGRKHDEPLQHRAAAEFYRQIEALPNASIVDLTETFWEAKSDTKVFLKQDTHWTPEGMLYAVQEIASLIKSFVEAKDGLSQGELTEVSNIGDLVEQLNLPGGGSQFFLPESAEIIPVNGFVSDPTSPVVLLGDSFTNIYSQKSLGWGEDSGLAQHLALELGQPLDVIARNGQASTGVRRELASRGKEHLKKKKVVIWAIAARDLFLSETAARENNVAWNDVVIPDIPDGFTSKSETGPITVKATLVMMSKIVDPKTVTYKNAVFVCEYKVDEVVEGKYAGDTILVTHWAFQDKQLSAASRREIGTQLELSLVPFDSKTEIKKEQGFDDYEDDIEKMLATRYWAEGESQAKADTANPKRANVIAMIACAIASLLVIRLARRLR